jgi:hypothetical protein
MDELRRGWIIRGDGDPDLKQDTTEDKAYDSAYAEAYDAWDAEYNRLYEIPDTDESFDREAALLANDRKFKLARDEISKRFNRIKLQWNHEAWQNPADPIAEWFSASFGKLGCAIIHHRPGGYTYMVGPEGTAIEDLVQHPAETLDEAKAAVVAILYL